MVNWTSSPTFARRTLSDERGEDFVGVAPWWRWLQPDEVWEPEAMICDCEERAVLLFRAGFESWFMCEECAWQAEVFEAPERARGRRE